ncbi:MAG: hypothetical protein WCW53_00060 [Syntrophales bacterium]
MQGNIAFNNIDNAFRTIGYKHSLIKKDYQYADLFSPGLSVPVRSVERAIFGQEPLDYRSACFGVRVAESNRPSSDIVRELKALGAPQIFILNNGIAERWAITEREPILQEKYQTINLPNVITQNIKEWNPKTVLRAKADFAKPAPRQMDLADVGLLPILENEAAKKLIFLLKAILNRAEAELGIINLIMWQIMSCHKSPLRIYQNDREHYTRNTFS